MEPVEPRMAIWRFFFSAFMGLWVFVNESFGQLHGDVSPVGVQVYYQVGRGRDERAVFQLEEQVDGRVVYRGNTADGSAASGIDDVKSHQLCPRQLAVAFFRELETSSSGSGAALLQSDFTT